jgi:hypothetical protein
MNGANYFFVDDVAADCLSIPKPMTFVPARCSPGGRQPQKRKTETTRPPLASSSQSEVLMIPYRRIMLACMADNPGADPEKLRREFICRVLADHSLLACRILGQYATKVHHRVVTEAATRAAQGERRQFAPPALLGSGQRRLHRRERRGPGCSPPQAPAGETI